MNKIVKLEDALKRYTSADKKVIDCGDLLFNTKCDINELDSITRYLKSRTDYEPDRYNLRKLDIRNSLDFKHYLYNIDKYVVSKPSSINKLYEKVACLEANYNTIEDGKHRLFMKTVLKNAMTLSAGVIAIKSTIDIKVPFLTIFAISFKIMYSLQCTNLPADIFCGPSRVSFSKRNLIITAAAIKPPSRFSDNRVIEIHAYDGIISYRTCDRVIEKPDYLYESLTSRISKIVKVSHNYLLYTELAFRIWRSTWLVKYP